MVDIVEPGPLEAAQLASLLDRAGALDADPGDVQVARETVERLFRECQPRIYGVCLRYLGDRERALEVSQDVLLTGFRRLGEYRGEGTFHAWLFGIARFKCIRAIEKKRDLLTADGVLEDGGVAAEALQGLRRAERHELVRLAATNVLDPLEQEAVHLRYVEGVSQERITELLGLSSSSGGRGLLQTCRRKLGREILRLLQERGHGISFFDESAV